MTQRQSIPPRFDRIAFYGTPSPRKLAELLHLDIDVLEGLAGGGLSNYGPLFKTPDGRTIETPLRPLKLVQRRIHQLLSRVGPPDYLFSAFKGRSAVGNAKFHADNARTGMVKLDIRSFYPSSDGHLVYSFFHDDLRCASDVAKIIFKLCTVRDTEVRKRAHLPTGAVTSPILAYYCYWRLFEELNTIALQNEAKFSVLADDITISGLREGHKVHHEAVKLLQRYGLKPRWKKQRNWPASHQNKLVTGVLVTQKGLRVPWKRKQRIKSFQDELAAVETKDEKNKAFQRLHGSLSSCGQIEPRFSSGAACILKDWKSSPAWQAHKRISSH